MRIFAENTESYLRLLAESISKDPASLESWQCLHLQLIPEETVSQSALASLKETYKHADCDVVLCPDNEILMISKELNSIQLQQMSDILLEQCTYVPDIVVYDLFMDWRKVRRILQQKTAQQPRDAVPQRTATPVLAETKSLDEVFAVAKDLRKERQSHYVLVVDDDATTRRMVSSAFKDKYAMISAADAREAVVEYLIYAPEIVFLDINLPDNSGFDVLHQLVTADSTAYIVMLSGNSYLDNVTQALHGGASGFVAKPFSKEKMARYIEDSALHHRKYA